MKKLKLMMIPLALLLLVGVFLYARINAGSFGAGVGSAAGTVTGLAVGSFKGVTEGLSEGAAAGKEEGLSAQDTTTQMSEQIESMGRLEVLVAGVQLTNLHNVGDYYKALYLAQGNAVFTVDLASCQLSFNESTGEVFIWLPALELDLYLDETQTEKLAETQGFSWTSKAKEGIVGYLNSMDQVTSKAEECISGYETLVQTAEEAAISQVSSLARSVLVGSYKTVHVQFQTGGDN